MCPAPRTYRCFLKDAQGHIGGVHEIEALSDVEAEETCRRLMRAQSAFVAAELWLLDRLVRSLG